MKCWRSHYLPLQIGAHNDMSWSLSGITLGVSLLLNDHPFSAEEGDLSSWQKDREVSEFKNKRVAESKEKAVSKSKDFCGTSVLSDSTNKPKSRRIPENPTNKNNLWNRRSRSKSMGVETDKSNRQRSSAVACSQESTTERDCSESSLTAGSCHIDGKEVRFVEAPDSKRIPESSHDNCSQAKQRGWRLTLPRESPNKNMVAGDGSNDNRRGSHHCPHSTLSHHNHSSDTKADLSVKIILLGDYSVGKSSLLRVLARSSDHFDDNEEMDEMIANASVRSTVKGNSLTRTGSVRSTTSNAGSRGGSLTRSGQSPTFGTRGGSLTRSGQVPTPRSMLVRSCLKPGGFVEVEFTHQEKTVLARISDTGGQERYRSMTTSYYRGAHGCLLMFDVTKEESFVNLDSWLENIDSYKTVDDFPCILVGTRCKSTARRVENERAAGYADSRGLPYMELDMAHMTDVRRVFEALLDSVTLNLCKRAPIGISIVPSITNENVLFKKNVVCSC